MDTLMTETVHEWGDHLKVFDVRRPGVWVLLEVTWRGVHVVRTSCEAGEAMAPQAVLLAALAV